MFQLCFSSNKQKSLDIIVYQGFNYILNCPIRNIIWILKIVKSVNLGYWHMKELKNVLTFLVIKFYLCIIFNLCT